MEQVTKTKQQSRAQFSLTDEQIETIINSAESFRDRLVLKLLAGTGARRAEIASIKTGNIDFAAGEIVITGKGRKERILFITPALAQEIKIFIGKRNQRFLFESKITGRAITIKTINQICKNAGERAGIKNPVPGMKTINPHLFRHTYARHLKRKGVAIESIADAMGHKSVAVTLNAYGRPSNEESKAAILKALT